MAEKPYSNPLFESLIYNEAGQPAEVAFIGPEAHYVILEGDFKRHVEARTVDRQIVAWLQEQIFANKDLVTEGMMAMLGKDDLFTKAMIDSSIKNVDQLMEHGIPDDARMWLGMMGFKVTVNVHGEVLQISSPTQELPDDYD
ncbi:MAG: hypothetical protein ACE5G8_08490 [Anaerolineae bacterium]